MRSLFAALGLALALTGCTEPTPPPAEKASAVVYAAASLTDVLEAIGDLYEAEGHAKPKFSFAGSSVLARQLEQGGQADMFISADEDWMDYVADKSLIDPATRASLLTNELVIVAPARAPFTLELANGMDLVGALKGGKLALADPESVPAGKYAREALTHFSVWESVEASVARTDNVRAALRFVETGDAAAGIVYATDARAAGDAVVVVATFPAQSHTPIIYPVALLRGRSDGPGKDFLAFLSSDRARQAFADAGFGVSR